MTPDRLRWFSGTLRVATIVLTLACGRTDAASSARTSNPEADPPVEVAPLPVDSALVARAREMVAAGRPGFREWPEDQYAPLQPNGTAATRLGPVIGDFDSDGQPDVVFDGWDRDIEVVPVVLSNHGQPKLLQVTEGPEVATPPVHRLTRISVTMIEWKGKPRHAVTFVTWAKDGRSIESRAPYIYVDGHFSQLIAGE